MPPPSPKKTKQKTGGAEDKESSDSESDEEVPLQVTKLPKEFVRKVPKLDPKTGEVELGEDTNEPIFIFERGEYTCYLHCHCKKWQEKSQEKYKALMQDISKKHRISLG